MKEKTDKKEEIKPEKLMNEGQGNKEKFQSDTFREIEGEIDEENIETIEDTKEKSN